MFLRTANNEEISVQEWSERFDLRSCIVPPKGKLFLQSDWAQIEVVALATVLDALLQRTSNLTKIINGTVRIDEKEYPHDVHTMLAALILEEPYESIYLLAKKDKRIAEARQMAKAAVFGLPGGMGVRSFIAFAQDAYGVTLSLEQAQRLKKLWFKLLGEDMHEYFDYIDCVWRKGVTQLVSGRVRKGLTYCSAANTLFQGLAADAAKYTMVALEWASETTPEEFHKLMPGLRTVGALKAVNYQLNQFIHDEFIGIADYNGEDVQELQGDYEYSRKTLSEEWPGYDGMMPQGSQREWFRLYNWFHHKVRSPLCLALLEKELLMMDCAKYYFRGLTVRVESQFLRRWSK